MHLRSVASLWLALTCWLTLSSAAGAQAEPAPQAPTQQSDGPIAPERTTDAELQPPPAPETLSDELDAVDAENQRRGSLDTIGGGPEAPLGYKYTSPLKQFGINLGMGVYGVNLFIGLAYLAFVYPVQAIVGSSTPQPIIMWNMIPLLGPVLASFDDSVEDKLVWRVVLITDASLQAAGLVIGLIGAALSGRRSERPQRETGFDLQVGAAGSGGASVTLRFRTL